MRASIIALLLILFVGMAGAVTITNSPIFSFGPEMGFYSTATIQAQDLYATDDLLVNDDAQVGDDLDVVGTLTCAVLAPDATTASNELSHDLTVLSGTDITAATGAEIFDYSASTAAFSTGQGTNTFNGNVVVSGSKTVTTGTGAVGIAGDATFSKTVAFSINTTMTADKTITSANTKTVYQIDASGGDVTLTLPDASTVTGREYKVALNGNPGANYGRIKSTAGKFGGANGIAAATGLKCTDDAGAGITLLSNGSDYLIVGAFGTWASG
jgi:hypothetical protein